MRTRTEHTPDATAMLQGGTRFTFREVSTHADHIAAELIRRGVVPGDRVAVRCPPTLDWLALLFGILRAGAVICPLNTRLPAEQMEARIRRLSPRLVLDAVPGKAASAGIIDPQPDRPATIVFTSGSGGSPRAVVHHLSHHLAAARGALAHVPLNADGRWLLTLPLYHVGGLALLFRSVLAGSAVALPAPGADWMEALEQSESSHVSLVPTHLIRLLRDGPARDRFPRLTRILLGGGPIPRELVRDARRAGWPVAASYGMTETASQVAAVPPDADDWTAEQSDGTPLPHAEFRIGADGEILVRGPSVTPGVWEDGTVRPLADAEGWLHTRDRGRLERGCLVVEGRMDAMFISGGENIHPEEIERVLPTVTGCSRAVVVPVADPEFGQRPAAWVDLPVDAGKVQAWRAELRKRLPGYMIPVRFGTLPEGEGLKPDREALSRRMSGASRRDGPTSA